jgi:modification methylase
VSHPAPFPVSLPRRFIELYTYLDDLVLDPFIGSGTTAVAALETGRRYVGYDVSDDYLRTARQRVLAAQPYAPPGGAKAGPT